MWTTIPQTLRFKISSGPDDIEGTIIEIPKGSKIDVDAATNFVAYGGFVPGEVRTSEGDKQGFRWITASTRLANTRLSKDGAGSVQTYESARFVKGFGHMAKIMSTLKKGDKFAVVGVLNTDKVESQKEGREFDFYDNVLALDIAVLRQGGKVMTDSESAAEPAKKTRRKAVVTE